MTKLGQVSTTWSVTVKINSENMTSYTPDERFPLLLLPSTD